MPLNWIYGRISRATVIILIYFMAINSVSKVAQSWKYVIKSHADFLEGRKDRNRLDRWRKVEIGDLFFSDREIVNQVFALLNLEY